MKIIILSLVLTFNFIVKAQESIVASGGDLNNNDVTVSFSLGQTMVLNFSNSDFSIGEGIQQPLENSILSIEDVNTLSDFKVFPIPTSNYLEIKINDFVIEHLTYEILDLNGKSLLFGQINSVSTKINIENLDQAIYLLNIRKDNSIIKTSKVLKL